jgi:hypothetical protein
VVQNSPEARHCGRTHNPRPYTSRTNSSRKQSAEKWRQCLEQGIITKHNLMKQSAVVINKPGGAGDEGFLDVKGSRGNPQS